TSAKDRATKSHQNFSQRTLVLVSYNKTTVLLSYESRCKMGRTSAKVRATKSRWNFYNERTRSTPFYPKLTVWCVLYHLGAFGTVWLPYKTRCKTGRTSAKVRATKSRQNFSQRMH